MQIASVVNEHSCVCPLCASLFQESISRAAGRLFDSSEDEQSGSEDDSHRFQIKPQFEGRAGQKVSEDQIIPPATCPCLWCAGSTRVELLSGTPGCGRGTCRVLCKSMVMGTWLPAELFVCLCSSWTCSLTSAPTTDSAWTPDFWRVTVKRSRKVNISLSQQS